MSVYVPMARGVAALEMLDRAPWASLGHAYGVGSNVRKSRVRVAKTGTMVERDPPTPERAWALMRKGEVVDGVDELASAVCCQGTLYESTPWVVPFLSAYAADPSAPDRICALLLLLAIAFGVCGAPDEPTTVEVRAAFSASAAHLRALEMERDEIATAARICRSLADATPSETEIEAARDALVAVQDGV